MNPMNPGMTVDEVARWAKELERSLDVASTVVLKGQGDPGRPCLVQRDREEQTDEH